MDFVNKSSCQSIRLIDDGAFTKFIILDSDGCEYVVSLFFRNIGGSGWSDKPYIKRIQVPSFTLESKQHRHSFSYLCGYAQYNGKDYYAFWDPENYLTHRTVRSCYLFISSFAKSEEKGYFMGINEGKEVMLCNSSGFEMVLKEISSRYRE